MATADRMWMVGAAAKAIGIDGWQLARLFQRHLVPEPRRFGRYRVIDPADLPQLREAAAKAGYFTEAAAAT
jgi:hypothetical protein